MSEELAAPLVLESLPHAALREVVGPGAERVLRMAGWPQPDAELTALSNERGLVARTGVNGYLLLRWDGEEPGLGKGASPPWVLTRSDRALWLLGDDPAGVLREVCEHDFRGFPLDGWLMTEVAGVAAWCARPRSRPEGLLLGCDPSHGDYFRNTLQGVIDDRNGSGALPADP
ncbi:hypothetical protein [Thiohalorhabdus methylotrophus]|uniref:Sarcosine oxidase subunit gamma n=1 Tax=Thiohalorhabdus methylotrophus TaxID=3242694 RepID=A0ABV4TTV3_9GAMM